MHDDPTASNLRETLEAVREALDIPNAATVSEQEIRDRILLERVSYVTVMLVSVLDTDRSGHPDISWEVAYLRERLADYPAKGYRTWEQAMAGHDAPRRAAS